MNLGILGPFARETLRAAEVELKMPQHAPGNTNTELVITDKITQEVMSLITSLPLIALTHAHI